MSESPPPLPHEPVLEQEESLDRLPLLWQLLKFEMKLVLDGLRDLVLAPAAIIAVLTGILSGERPDRNFRQLMLFGRRTERWLNLFGHHLGEGTSDRLFAPLEKELAEKLKTQKTVQDAERFLRKAALRRDEETKPSDISPDQGP